jgi:hypothetical protein
VASRRNPVEKRLGLVHDEWVEFSALPNARVLCLLVTPDEVPMVDAFVAIESDAGAGTLPDLFVRLTSAFEAATPYGFALCGEFLPIAQAMHQGLEDPATAAWTPPRANRGEDDVSLWVRTCASFAQHYAIPDQFACVLLPNAVADFAAFQHWLQRFAQQAPPKLRAIVLDDAKGPSLTPLVKAEPVRVIAKPLDLDMPGARLELSQEAGGLDTPGGQFRHLFVKMSNALGAMKLAEAEAFGAQALAITEAQSWFALAVPIHFALGAANAGAGQAAAANERYVKAERAAIEGEKAGDPTCIRLKAQARMARGGLLVGIGQYLAAAKLFTETVPLATAAQDPRMVLDCYRLTSFSYEQAQKYPDAWQAGIEGLGYAKQLDQETRQTSNLPYLGEGMLRIAARPEYNASLRIEQEMVGLLGRRDWRPQTAQAPAAAPAASPAGRA